MGHFDDDERKGLRSLTSEPKGGDELGFLVDPPAGGVAG